MKLTNSAIIEPPKLVCFGHPLMDIDNVGGILATRIENSDRIYRRKEMDIVWCNE